MPRHHRHFKLFLATLLSCAIASAEFVPHQVLVKYKSNRTANEKRAVLSSLGAVRSKSVPRIDVDVVKIPASKTVDTFLNELKQNPDIEFAEPNGILRALDVPNDPQYTNQYYLHSGYTDVESAWDISTGSATIVVAIIDTGVTLTHPDLASNLWVNPSPSGNSGLHGTRIELDWDENGACTDPPIASCLGAEQCAGSDPTDDNQYGFDASCSEITTNEYHGTRVSGIVGAVTNNASSMAGVCRNCQLMGVKALNDHGVGSYAAIAEGIVYAVDHGANVINMSLGGPGTSAAVTSAVNYAIAHNVVVVAAAGNDGNSSSVDFPASIDSVIAVGATNASNSLAYFSNTGSKLDLVAPGTGILSTIPPNTTSASGGDGTSFATPIVSGVAALIRSIAPTSTVADVTRYIDFTATDLGTSGFDNGYGFGLLNAKRALQAAQTGIIPPSVATPSETFPYPNPAHIAAGDTVTFSLSNALGSQDIEIKIFTVAGERVRTLSRTTTWDGKNEDGKLVASGLYFFYVKTAAGDAKGKVSIIK